MKLYRPTSKRDTDEAAQPGSARVPHVQDVPVTVPGEQGSSPQQVKVDLAAVLGSTVVIAGWSTARIDFRVQAGDEILPIERVKVLRPDVAAHFSIADQETGFILLVPVPAEGPLTLTWADPQGEYKQGFVLKMTDLALDGNTLSMVSPVLPMLLNRLPAFGDAWKSIVRLMSIHTTASNEAKAYIEKAVSCDRSGEGVVVGWMLHKHADAPVWIENEDGTIAPLLGQHRTYRKDVAEAFGYQFGAVEGAGLLAHVRGMKSGQRVQLKTLTSEGIQVLAETTCGVLPSDAVAAARKLFSLNVSLNDFTDRIAAVDEPIISKLLEMRAAVQDTLPRRETQLGTPPQAPVVSVVIPLYGRIDFIEHQLMEFCEDEWLMRNAELIYVIDDPALIDQFPGKIEALYRVYRTPLRWVWGGANRGFSGANNLGVACAKGEYLMFLNSDAFPQQAGWLEQLIHVLRTHPNIGAVGPRLVTAEGSIQHAGMRFARRADLGIWTNHHPNMGLDPALDPARELTIVPAVTGACMLMRRSDFDAVGGWDSGYLIGDFEDSDLCLKLRSTGFDIGYLPTVQLTHLERQSFKLLGSDEFRTRVVIYNAVRHQTRWKTLLESSDAVASI